MHMAGAAASRHARQFIVHAAVEQLAEEGWSGREIWNTACRPPDCWL